MPKPEEIKQVLSDWRRQREAVQTGYAQERDKLGEELDRRMQKPDADLVKLAHWSASEIERLRAGELKRLDELDSQYKQLLDAM